MSLSLIANYGPSKPGYYGGYSTLKDGEEVICNVEEWAFQSCGTMSFFGCNINLRWWTTENVDRLIAALKSDLPCRSGWFPKEVYLQLTDAQIKAMPGLKHPNVKEVDKYANKAHGPYTLYLFRISVDKDFT